MSCLTNRAVREVGHWHTFGDQQREAQHPSRIQLHRGRTHRWLPCSKSCSQRSCTQPWHLSGMYWATKLAKRGSRTLALPTVTLDLTLTSMTPRSGDDTSTTRGRTPCKYILPRWTGTTRRMTLLSHILKTKSGGKENKRQQRRKRRSDSQQGTVDEACFAVL